MRAIESLIKHAVDYAGLFPPASLPMDQVVSNYAMYAESIDRPMLGRIVVPVGRLAEFESLAIEASEQTQAELPWRISALVPSVDQTQETGPFVEACEILLGFNEAHNAARPPRLVVDSIEVKTESPDQVEETVKRAPAGLLAFLEIDWAGRYVEESIARIANSASNGRVFAKIRTGSIVADQIPGIEPVASFIRCCAQHAVGFKATAGLHHPFRNQFRLTYENDPPTGTLHGFVNVFVAALFAFEHHIDRHVISEILSESEPSVFKFEDDQLVWKGFHVKTSRIWNLREKAVLSFGSCSFDEPSQELKAALNCNKLFVDA